jgi:phosphonopyruvate decarboxylase
MIKVEDFWEELKKRGFVFFSGVPCSIFKETLGFITQNPLVRYIPAPREDIALGVCSGAFLAGKRSAILIQNSGLGHIVNALTSFNLIYKIPLLMFITWRGYEGKDAPEHIVMGKKMTFLLEDIGIAYKVLSADFRKDLDWAVKLMNEESVPVALLVKDGSLK